ncbi:MAG: tetratricopeptide repeat protein [Planctomycetota bacterium]|nr:tetratricopeptide repeat protein [Planctomycetota bacterium]
MTDAEEQRWDSLAAQADAYLRSGNAEQLEAIAAQLIEARPHEAFGFRMRAEADLQRDRHKDAVKAFEQALACDPEDDFVHYRLGVAERRRERYDVAEKHVDRAIRIDPDYAPYWVEKAEIAYWSDDPDAALDALDHALDLDPESTSALHLRARIEDRRTVIASPAVIQHYHDALDAEPDNAYVHYNLSTAHLERGEIDEAERHVGEALRLEPANSEFRGTFYEVLRRQSLVYQALSAPGRWLRTMWYAFSKVPWWAWFIACLAKIGWVVLLFALALTLLYCVLLWPVLKAWQFFTLGDLRARASAVAPRKRGVHRWPFPVRMGLFLLLTAAFWYGIWRFARTDGGSTTMAWLFVGAIGVYLVLGLWGTWQSIGEWRQKRRRRRALVGEDAQS